MPFPNQFHSCRLLNPRVDLINPWLSVAQPDSTSYQSTLALAYYQVPGAYDRGFAYFRYDDAELTPFAITHATACIPPLQFTPCMPSRSNEWKIVRTSCAPAINTSGNSIPYFANSSNASVVSINSVSTTDNTAITVATGNTTITFYEYLLNDDYTGENTNYGNAISKQIENSVTFANNQFAEDLTVWLTAYRPPATDFKVYGKVYNTADADSFDSKDWTLLQDANSNFGLNSSMADQTDDIELTYSLGNTPNSDFTFTGSANVSTSGFSNLVGTQTTWSTNATANLMVGDLVKFYQPLFPAEFQISVVTSVHSDTLITISDPVTNNEYIGTPLSVDLIRKYKYQAFNNQLNDNITRYYSSNMVAFDTFNVMQLKVVFLSVAGNTIANTQEYLPQVPYIDDIRAVATSA